jgi:acyl carrier protein
MKSTEDVYGNVKTVLMEALLVDSDEIVPQATLQGGLGAESIDFLDIMFRLEHQFGIQIPLQESTGLRLAIRRKGWRRMDIRSTQLDDTRLFI